MADGFEAMVDAAQPFFAELKQNNEKAWFEPRKAHYTEAIRKPGELFANLMAEDLARITGRSHSAKVFRIYRDVRFSKDKSPYNPWLHMIWSPDGGGPVWFFGVEPESMILGHGLMAGKGAALTALRALIDAEGDALAQEMQHLETAFDASLSHYGADPLKRVPKPYDPDHPHGDLLRRKSLLLTAPVPANWREIGLIAAVGQVVNGFQGFSALLQSWKAAS